MSAKVISLAEARRARARERSPIRLTDSLLLWLVVTPIYFFVAFAGLIAACFIIR
jgi:hypothetical protein